jgi:predicted Zn-dependent peptidase
MRPPGRRLALLLALLVAQVPSLADDTPPQGMKLPRFERAQLRNGAQLVLVEKRDTPLVSLAVVVRGGALGDAPGREGTAALLAELLQKGAGSRDAAGFAEAVEGVGGQLSAAAGRETLAIGASFLAKDTDLMVGLVADMLMRPRLDAAEFGKARELAVQSIAAAKDGDPSALIGDYGVAWLFDGHPYGRPANGEPATLESIELDDLKRYYDEQLGGDRLLIAAVGDIDAVALQRKLASTLGSWRRAAAAAPTVAKPVRVSGRRVLLVDKPGATQTYFWLGNVGASRTDPARTAQAAVNTLLGGRFTSMLNTELRIRSGLTYGAVSSFDRLREPGAFAIESYAQTEKTGPALDLALAVLDRLHESGVAADALASARQYMLGQFPTTLETNGQLASRFADLLLYDLGPDDVDGYAARVMAVDEAAATSAIATAFPKPEDLAIVLIGDATQIRDVAKKYGPVTEIRLAAPTFRAAPAAAGRPAQGRAPRRVESRPVHPVGRSSWRNR